MNPHPYAPYPQAAQTGQTNYAFQSYTYPAPQQGGYQYATPQLQQPQQSQQAPQQGQPQAYNFGPQQHNPQLLRAQPQSNPRSSNLTPQPQPHPQPSSAPPAQPQQAQQQRLTPHQQPPAQQQHITQQRHNVQRSSSPSSDAGSGVENGEPNLAEAELERQLMDALNNEPEEGQESMAQMYPNHGGEDEPIYRMPPPPEATYPSEHELDRAMHEWSLEHGYELVRRACKKNARGEQYKRYYDCSRHSRKKSKLRPEDRQRKNRKAVDSKCPMSVATVAVDPANPNGEWQIRHRKTHHNHPAIEGKHLAGHRRRFRDANVQKAVDGLFAIGTSTSQVVQFLQRTSPNGLFTRTDVANMKLKWNKHGTCKGPIKEGEPRNKAAFKAAGGACHMCRTKHDACEGTRPTCANCTKRGTQCVYDPLNPAQSVAARSAPQHSLDMDFTIDASAQQQQQRLQDPAQPPDSAPPMIVPLPPRKRGRPPKNKPPPVDAAEAGQILQDLRSFQQDNFLPQRLELKSSAVEYLAQSTCGTGDSYKDLPMLSSPDGWEDFKNAVMMASMKENTRDVLTGEKGEPQRPPVPAGSIGKAEEVQAWNEYIKQLAIYRRRNELLVAAIWQHLTQYYRNRIHNITKASAVWSVLEDTFQPRGCETAFKLFCDIQSITLANSSDLKEYIHRLESTYERFKKLPLNTSRMGGQFKEQHRIREGAEAMPEEMVCLLFLQNLGPGWKVWVNGTAATTNIAGFGTGARLGLKELCKRAVGYEMQQRRELGRS